MKSAAAMPADGVSTGGETSLESFVAQLHQDGVVAGQREAERLVRAASVEAAELMRRSRAEADALLLAAREQAEREQQRGHAELELAARNTLLQLQRAIEDVLDTLLQRDTDPLLRRPDFLGELIIEVVRAYAQADALGRPTAIRLPHALLGKLAAVTAELLAAGLQDDLEVVASLRESGFEYQLSSGGTVEVSTASVVELMLEQLPPRLRDIVARAAQATGQTAATARAATARPGAAAPPL